MIFEGVNDAHTFKNHYLYTTTNIKSVYENPVIFVKCLLCKHFTKITNGCSVGFHITDVTQVNQKAPTSEQRSSALVEIKTGKLNLIHVAQLAAELKLTAVVGDRFDQSQRNEVG